MSHETLNYALTAFLVIGIIINAFYLGKMKGFEEAIMGMSNMLKQHQEDNNN